ncbi:MAG: hypothetical protein AB7G54_00485 [Methyloceanibacter sp.]
MSYVLGSQPRFDLNGNGNGHAPAAPKQRFLKVYRMGPGRGSGVWYANFDIDELREVEGKIQEAYGGGRWRVETWSDSRKESAYEVVTEGAPRDRQGRDLTQDDEQVFETDGRSMSYGQSGRQFFDPTSQLQDKLAVLAAGIERRDKAIEEAQQRAMQADGAKARAEARLESLERELAELRRSSEAERERLKREFESERERLKQHAEHQLALARLEARATAANGESQSDLMKVLLTQAFRERKSSQFDFTTAIAALKDLQGLTDRGEPDGLAAWAPAVTQALSFLAPKTPQGATETAATSPAELKNDSALPACPQGAFTTPRFTQLLKEGLETESMVSDWAELAWSEIGQAGRSYLAAEGASIGTFAGKVPGLDLVKLGTLLNAPENKDKVRWIERAFTALRERALN